MAMFAASLPHAMNPAPRLLPRRRIVWLACCLSPVAFCFGFLPGCGAINPTPTIATVGGREAGKRIDRAPQQQRIEALAVEISAISPEISPEEAGRCASRAIRYTALLASAHGLTHVAEFNCFMVNIGVKRRGQCFQLAEDLKAELVEQDYQTLVFTRGVAYWGDLLREHNCIVVTAPGQPFDEGLVLDPWRNPGVLRWARVKLDDYPWIQRIVPKPTSAPAQSESHAQLVSAKATSPR